MISTSIDTTQLRTLAADLARASVSVRQPVGDETRATATRVRDVARQLVRKRTGATARSISVASRGLQHEIGPTDEAGQFLEYGTRKMPAYPFMGPAVESQAADLPDRVAKAAADATLTTARIF